jgi:hypothetical protein
MRHGGRTHYLGTVQICCPIFPDHLHIVWDAVKLEGRHIEFFVLDTSGFFLLRALAVLCLFLLA